MDVLTNLWELGVHGETLSAVDGRVFMYQATPGASNALKEVRELRYWGAEANTSKRSHLLVGGNVQSSDIDSLAVTV